MLKAVILMGGPQKGTRFRPLSLELPKPLFPIAGRPMVQHLIKAVCQVPNMKEVFLIGAYQLDESLNQFISNMSKEYRVVVKYLQEYTALGTAGGVYHFRDQIRIGSPEGFFVLNGDVCGHFELEEMLKVHKEAVSARLSPTKNGDEIPKKLITIMATEATREQSVNFGCIVEDNESHEILHYVEKPETFVSHKINCGVYLCSTDIFHHLAAVFNRKHTNSLDNSYDSSITADHNDNMELSTGSIQFEEDVLMPLAGQGKVFVYHTQKWWSQIKTAGSVIYANMKYLEQMRTQDAQLLTKNSQAGPKIIGDVIIDPSAKVDPSATLGPNVSISSGVRIGAGVRVKDSIVLRDATISDHSLVKHSIIGWNNVIGSWSRIEGTPCDPDPNSQFARTDNCMLFNGDGKLNPSITVLGSNVQVPSEIIVLNSIVLPHKELSHSYKNEIIL
ncbi:Mannose-1-phosphate guanyltransferase alpha-A [Halotydeus destructor]|nr:Mannose-1-phosphate guanyltransferase alpha-A [Halotydeus destructor]